MRTLIALFVLAVPAAQAQYAFRIGDGANDWGRGVIADAAGNTFVTGKFSFAADFDPGPGEAILSTDTFGDAFVASYDAGGAYRWAFQLPREGEGSSGLDIAHAPPSDLVVAGQFSLTTDFDPDPDEEVLLATACNEGSAFLARYADNGAPGGADLRWAFPLGGCVKDDFVPGINMANGVAVTPQDEALVAGSFRGTADFDPGPGEALLSVPRGSTIFLAKYGSDGSYRWALDVEGGESPVDIGEALAVAASADGGAVMVGNFVWPADFDPDPGAEHVLTPIGGAGRFDAFVASYDDEGEFRWAFNLGSPSGDTEGWDVALDAEGNAYVTGDFGGPTDFDPDPSSSHVLTPSVSWGNGFLASYDADGHFRWAFPFDAAGGSEARSLALDAAGHIAASGRIDGTVDFDPGPGEAVFSGTSDAFLASYAGDGTYRWALVLGSPVGYAEPRALASLPGSRWGMSGELYGTVDFDPGPGEHFLEAAGSNPLVWSDIFVASYTDGGGFPVRTEAGVPEAETLRLAVAPNPARGRTEVTVAVPSVQRVRVEVYDVLGRHVAVLHDGQAVAGPLRLGVEAGTLAPGVYVLRVVGETFRAAQTMTRLR